MNLILHLATTVPPVHDSGQEAILHEPWQVLLSQFLTLGLVVATTVIASRNSKKVKDVGESITSNVGIANGNGSLMEQATVHSKRIGELAEHQYTIKDQLADHVDKAESRFDEIERALSQAARKDQVDQLHTRLEQAASKEQVVQVQGTLDGHISESATYRAGVEEKLSALAESASTTQDDLRAHVQWEETVKWPEMHQAAVKSAPQKKAEPKEKP